MSSLTAMNSLDASGNYQLSDGLQHLAGLGRLQHLGIDRCSFTALPLALGSLTA